MKLIFATNNFGKLKEIKTILEGLNILSVKEVGVTLNIVEDGTTFEENALKKARFVAEKSKEWTIADDSGLCIKALGNAPGVFSARWSGEDASDEELIRYTLGKIKDIPEEKREAWFETAVALATPDGKHWVFKGKIEGRIARVPRGKPRPKLPYDIIFIPKGYNRTLAEMSDEEKNSLSHRGLALEQLKEFLVKLVTKDENGVKNENSVNSGF